MKTTVLNLQDVMPNIEFHLQQFACRRKKDAQLFISGGPYLCFVVAQSYLVTGSQYNMLSQGFFFFSYHFGRSKFYLHGFNNQINLHLSSLI